MGRIPSPIFYETNVAVWKQSLQRLIDLPGELCLLQSHGSLEANGREALQATHDYLSTIEDTVHRAANELQTNDFREVCAHLYGPESIIPDHTAGEIGPHCLVRGVLDPPTTLPATIPEL